MSARLNRWKKVAHRLGEIIPREDLNHEVLAQVAPPERRWWVVAVSGGADSVALLLLLWIHWPEHRDRLVLAHFDHRLRGRASRADAAFCRRLAKALGIACDDGSWDNPPADPSEAAARAVRQSFLESVRRRYRARFVWTGHHADDVAESMLMRLARGSGTAGLAAPRPVQANDGCAVKKLRPLLNLRSGSIREALRQAKGEWREDQSNQSGRFLRNRMRRNVVSDWERAAERDAVKGAGLSRQLLEEDDIALNCWLDEIGSFDELGRLNLRRLSGKPIALWRRALRRWLTEQPYSGDLARSGFEDLLRLARNGKTTRFSLGKTGFVRIRRGWLFFEQPFAE